MATLKEKCESLSEQLESYTTSDLQSIYSSEASGAPWGQFDRVMRRIDRAGLDLFRDQAYIVRKEDKKTGDIDLEFRSSIQALRMRADQTGKYTGQRGPWWTADGKEWVDVWLPDEPPAAAMVEVLREDFEEPIRAVAKFDEYAARYRSGDLMAMWADMKAHMIAKCAEALGLKRAFPQRLGGIVTRAEMHRDDEGTNQRGTADQPPSSKAQEFEQALSDAPDRATPNAPTNDPDPTDEGAGSRDTAQDDGPVHDGEQPGADETTARRPDRGNDATHEAAGGGGAQGVPGETGAPVSEGESEAQSGAPSSEGNPQGPAPESSGASSVAPQDVKCSYCGAPAGNPCTTDDGDVVDYYHKDRRERAQAADGQADAFASQAVKKVREWREDGRDVQELVGSISVQISDWPDEDWETVVQALEEEWDGAREECDLRRTPEELRE